MSLTDKHPAKTWTEEIKAYCLLSLKFERGWEVIHPQNLSPLACQKALISPFEIHEIHSFQPA